jgi:hypothetical protein
LMARDKEAHQLGLKELIANLHESEVREVLLDACVAAKIRDPSQLPALVVKQDHFQLPGHLTIQDHSHLPGQLTKQDTVSKPELKTIEVQASEEAEKENSQTNEEQAVVKHYMELFGISDLRNVVPTMNAHFRRTNELNNFWKAICSEILVDHKVSSVNACFEELTKKIRVD